MSIELRRTTLGAVVVLAVAGVFLLGYSLRHALVLMALALVLATALDPLARRLERLGLSRANASLLIHFALLGGAAAISIFLLPPAGAQVRALIAKLPDLAVALQVRFAGSTNALVRHIATLLPQPASQNQLPPERAQTLASALSVVQSMTLGSFHALVVFALSHAWLVEGQSAVRRAARLLPPHLRARAVEIDEAARAKVGAYVRGVLIVCASSATISCIGYLLFRLPDALVLGLITGAGESVPIIGPVAGAVPALAVAFSLSPSRALWVALFTLVNHLLHSYVVLPRVMGRTVGVSPLVVVLSLSAFASLFGVLGAVLAIPLAAVLQLLVDRLLLHHSAPHLIAVDDHSREGVIRLHARAPAAAPLSPNELALRTAAVFLVAVVALLIWTMRGAVLTLALAVILAASLEPVIRALTRRRVPRIPAIALAYVGAALICGAAAVLAAGAIPDEARAIGDSLQRAFAAIRAAWPDTLFPPLPASLDGAIAGMGHALLDASTSVLQGLLQLGLAMILSLCWCANSESIERLWLSLVPLHHRARTRDTWRSLVDAAGRQLRAEVAQSLLALMLVYPLFTLLHVPYTAVTALAVAVLRAVPLFGIPAAAAVAFFAAASTVPHGLAALVVTLALLAALDRWVGRPIIGARASRLTTSVTLLGLFEAAGPIGLLIAPVVAALIQAAAHPREISPVPQTMEIRPAASSD